jgi:CysZ protein
MISSLLLAFDDLADRRFRRYIWLSIGGAIAIFAVLWIVITLLLTHSAITAIPWLDTTIDVLGGIAVAVLSWLLFPGVVGLVSGLLLDGVADAVEARDYPHLAAARDQGWGEILRTTAKFAGIVVLGNLIVLPLYLVPVVNIVVFYGLNGYLLGREYYELVAYRRLDEPAAVALRRRSGLRWFVAGLVIAILMTIPILNLVMPIIATAFMVHLFQAARR